jgi:uncharacterized RDD family membrane protein YckC
VAVVDRRDVAGWLDGPSAGGGDAGQYAGQRLGLPAEGPGRVAGLGARVAAFLVDAVLCAAIAWGVAGDQAWTTPIFALEVLVLTALGGSSGGQRVRGLRVIRLDGRHPDPGRVAVRTVLLLLLIPAVIYDRDGRGLHDKAAGTVLVHTR